MRAPATINTQSASRIPMEEKMLAREATLEATRDVRLAAAKIAALLPLDRMTKLLSEKVREDAESGDARVNIQLYIKSVLRPHSIIRTCALTV